MTLSDSFIALYGYRVFRADRDLNGGGIVVYIRDTYCDVCILPIKGVLPDKSLAFCLRIADVNFVLMAVYHPYWNNAIQHQIMISSLQQMLDDIGDGDSFVLCGDVNNLRHHLADFFKCNGLVQLIDFFTRGSNILDIFATNVHECFQQPVPLSPLGKSDHMGFYIPSREQPCFTTTKVKVRAFTPSTYARCLGKLSSTDWHTVCLLDGVDGYREHNIDEALAITKADIESIVNKFQQYLYKCYDECCPEKTVRMRSDNPPWFTPSLKVLFDAKDRSLHRNQYQKYLCLREKFKEEVIKAKERYAAKVSRKMPLRKQWQVINAVTGRGHQQNGAHNYDVNAINTKFASVFHLSHNFSDLLGSLTDRNKCDFRVTPNIVRRSLSAIKSNASGTDNIPGHFYRMFLELLIMPICQIYNYCIALGYFPLLWKMANVRPIPKGDGDLRPISILPFLGKGLERIIRDYLIMPYVTDGLCCHQFAFIPNHFGGCTNALTCLRLSTLQHLAAHGGYVRLLAVDFRKAFDKVSHNILFDTLCQQFNLPYEALLMIHSFLSDRQQRVMIKSSISSWLTVTSGVVQGSVLGPLLFSLFINDIRPYYDNTSMVVYADDVTIIHHVAEAAMDHMQSEVNIFADWVSSKQLIINYDKTKSMIMKRSNVDLHIPNLTLHGNSIENVPSLKILGVAFDEDTKWCTYSRDLLAKSARAMAVVRKVYLAKCPGFLIWSTYLALVFSIVAHCWPAVCDLPRNILQQLNTYEKTARRWSGNAANNSSTLSMRLDGVCKRLIKCIASHVDHPLSKFFIRRDAAGRLLRRQRILMAPKSNKAYFTNTFIKYSTLT